MRRREIEKILRDTPYWKKQSSELERMEFCQAMRGCQYGWDALTQAFAWFHEGWRRAQ